jgi:hypothetical protein
VPPLSPTGCGIRPLAASWSECAKTGSNMLPAIGWSLRIVLKSIVLPAPYQNAFPISVTTRTSHHGSRRRGHYHQRCRGRPCVSQERARTFRRSLSHDVSLCPETNESFWRETKPPSSAKGSLGLDNSFDAALKHTDVEADEQAQRKATGSQVRKHQPLAPNGRGAMIQRSDRAVVPMHRRLPGARLAADPLAKLWSDETFTRWTMNRISGRYRYVLPF